MALDKQQLKSLLSSVAKTRDAEIDCDECLAGMAEFAELELLGSEVPEALRSIRNHIEICPECTEEYEVLLSVLAEASSKL